MIVTPCFMSLAIRQRVLRQRTPHPNIGNDQDSRVSIHLNSALRSKIRFG